MSASDLRELSVEELEDRLGEAKEELFNLRFQLATNQLDNTARVGAVKKEIARILTVLREQEIEAWRAQQAAAGKDS
jgi:large subunit ribosomal protein L29